MALQRREEAEEGRRKGLGASAVGFGVLWAFEWGGEMRGEIWTTEWAEGCPARRARALTERERDGTGKSDAVAKKKNRKF